jgi:hypothetical protein
LIFRVLILVAKVDDGNSKFGGRAGWPGVPASGLGQSLLDDFFFGSRVANSRGAEQRSKA